MTPEERAKELGCEVEMLLEEGFVCSDCVHFQKVCMKLFGCDPNNEYCDWCPSIFRR